MSGFFTFLKGDKRIVFKCENYVKSPLVSADETLKESYTCKFTDFQGLLSTGQSYDRDYIACQTKIMLFGPLQKNSDSCSSHS